MVFTFSLDKITSKYVPASIVPSLPQPLKRFLGGNKPIPRADYLLWLDILVSSFCAIALLEGVFKGNTVFRSHHSPMIIASYGASVILCFNSISAPLAQPRNVFWGHFISSLIGVCISKLFSLSSMGRANYWASGALSVGVSSVLMSIFNCVHPPAGASALLPSADEGIREMSWWYLPEQIVSSVLIIAVACITNNIIRSYPVYWWVASKPSPSEAKKSDIKIKEEITQHTLTDEETISKDPVIYTKSNLIQITSESIEIPAFSNFSTSEVKFLENLRLKLKTNLNNAENI